MSEIIFRVKLVSKYYSGTIQYYSTNTHIITFFSFVQNTHLSSLIKYAIKYKIKYS